MNTALFPKMEKDNKRITIELPSGLKLVAEQNLDREYQNEIYIGIETLSGDWCQDLAIVRNAYTLDDNLVVRWKPDEFEVLVFADKNDEAYTDKFSISSHERRD